VISERKIACKKHFYSSPATSKQFYLTAPQFAGISRDQNNSRI